MREIRTSGSEGGGVETNRCSLPLSSSLREFPAASKEIPAPAKEIPCPDQGGNFRVCVQRTGYKVQIDAGHRRVGRKLAKNPCHFPCRQAIRGASPAVGATLVVARPARRAPTGLVKLSITSAGNRATTRVAPTTSLRQGEA